MNGVVQQQYLCVRPRGLSSLAIRTNPRITRVAHLTDLCVNVCVWQKCQHAYLLDEPVGWIVIKEVMAFYGDERICKRWQVGVTYVTCYPFLYFTVLDKWNESN